MSQTYKGCSHENRLYLVTYKPQIIQGVSSEESPKLLCFDCFKNPDFVNDTVVDLVFNILTGKIIK